MEVSVLFDNIMIFLQENILMALAGAVVAGFLAYRKIKVFLTVSLIALLVAGVFYLITDLGSKGTTHKSSLVSTKSAPH